MAAGVGKSLGVERLLSYTEDLVGVLRANTDRDGNAQVGAVARRLLSSYRSEFDDLELHIKGPLVTCPVVSMFSVFLLDWYGHIGVFLV